MGSPLHRALAVLLGLGDLADLPLDTAVEATVAPQATLERLWNACGDPLGLVGALWAFAIESYEFEAHSRAWTVLDERSVPFDARADAIRAAVPCPQLPTEAPCPR